MRPPAKTPVNHPHTHDNADQPRYFHLRYPYDWILTTPRLYKYSLVRLSRGRVRGPTAKPFLAMEYKQRYDISDFESARRVLSGSYIK